jgi:hypothetical protein
LNDLLGVIQSIRDRGELAIASPNDTLNTF